MKVFDSFHKVQREVALLKKKGNCVGFVPTMGALHRGHLSLIDKARKENDIVAVSIFVNPIQFCKGEDFKKYPRPLKKDIESCRSRKVDIVYCPAVKDLYPSGFSTYVSVEGPDKGLCAEFRPGHFRGVATVVSKLFNIVLPDRAYFGQKDAQQAAVIRKMAEDLNIPVKIKVLPTVREKSGLAMSSRNEYLNGIQRKDAVVLYEALKLAGKLLRKGERRSAVIKNRMQKLINSKKGIKLEYIAITDPDTLKPVRIVAKEALIALAAYVGGVRLIDNITWRGNQEG